MSAAKARGRSSRLHSRSDKLPPSRSPPISKGNKNGTNKKRVRRNPKQNINRNQPDQQQQNRPRVKSCCSSCGRQSKKCRCRCTHCECHHRGCGRLFKNCQCESRQFGSYRCLRCKKQWRSGYTFVRGRGPNGRALYGQQCKSCNDRRYHRAYKWRELEAVQCPECGEKPCDKNPPCRRKPHQQALCKRCRNSAVPCSGR